MKKRSTFMRIATVAMALCLILACGVFGSVAKYTSQATGSDVATVASWKVTVNNIDLADAEANDKLTTNFNLFALPNTNVEQTDGLIAPGTSGSFTFAIANDSQVTADYTIELSAAATNGGAPIQYSLNGTDGWVNDIAELDIGGQLGHTENTSATHTVYWQWTSASDVADTALGVAAQTAPGTITITAVVNAEQVITGGGI